MSWKHGETVVIGGNTIDDPSDRGVNYREVEIALYELTESDGEPQLEEYDEGSEVNTSSSRQFELDMLGFEKEAQDPDGEFQDWSTWLKLRYILLKLPYRWIQRTYRWGADHSLGPIPRAAEDGTDSLWHLRGEEYLIVDEDDTEDYPFDPPGILPYPIRPAGKPSVEREDGTGFYTGSIELDGEEYD